jgi:hypothetical protein
VELERRLEAFFKEYADPQYDMWHGGKSKAKRLGAGQRSDHGALDSN